MIRLTLPDLMQYLQSNELTPQLQEATKQIFIVFKMNRMEYPLFLKTDGQILQLLLFLPCIIQPQMQADVARFLHLLNKELDLPGFGMDEGPGVIFYRCILPSTNGSIHQLLLDNYIITMKKVGQVFTPIVSAVANGLRFDQAVVKVRETLKELMK